jgi:hypothetical protein
LAKSYDVFNGDADGICALHQLRLAEPREAELVTGVKRDIGLLARVPAAAGDRITVLDLSLSVNRPALEAALAAGATVCWFDHHHAGTIPSHPALETHIDLGSGTCTSLIVDRHLGGAHTAWAVVGACGDNLEASALDAARRLGLAEGELRRLQRLGAAINYNAYGETLADLHYPPAELYRVIAPYRDPFDLLASEPVAEVLENAMLDDLARAAGLPPVLDTAHAAAWVLPDAAWARRVSGELANRLARDAPQRAHAVLTTRADGYVVSVRAPLAHPDGADALCRQFETGGGRAAAAGVQRLPAADLGHFLASFARAFGSR